MQIQSLNIINRYVFVLGLVLMFLPTNNTFAQFVTTWKTTTDNEAITIPTADIQGNITDYDFTINWGDGTTETITGDDPDPSHTYATAGTYTVEISGVFPWMRHNFSDADNAAKLQTVEQWGDIQWENMESMFAHATNMTYNATDVPNLSQVTDMSYMFLKASNFNGAIGNWDVSNVTDMYQMFFQASAFNQDLNSWDVSNVTDMGTMFFQASAFNQPLDGWGEKVANVTNMKDMFYEAVVFNQDLNSWNVSSVTDMSSMFQFAESFNGNISDWNVSNVTDMSEMFYEAVVFNQDLNSWNVSSVTDMRSMFDVALAFNQPLDDWDVSSVTDMSYMFSGAAAFNQPLGNWNVSNVTDMTAMFWSAYYFDQPLGTWDVSSVTSMRLMFWDSPFNQDISNWQITAVTNMDNMFNGSLLRTNYDAILNGWSQLTLQPNVSLTIGYTFYSADAEADRQSIINNNGWSIYDAGPFLFNTSSNTVIASGAGTEANPYIITTPAELDAMRHFPNAHF